MSSSVRRFKKVGIWLVESISRALRALAILFIACYRTIFTSQLGGACRFEPSCSSYALQAFQKHSLQTATHLTFTRLCKCRPGGAFGYDPVPLSSHLHFKRQGQNI